LYIIYLNKLRFDQTCCSERSGTLSQFEVIKWYETARSLGTPD